MGASLRPERIVLISLHRVTTGTSAPRAVGGSQRQFADVLGVADYPVLGHESTADRSAMQPGSAVLPRSSAR